MSLSSICCWFFIDSYLTATSYYCFKLRNLVFCFVSNWLISWYLWILAIESSLPYTSIILNWLRPSWIIFIFYWISTILSLIFSFDAFLFKFLGLEKDVNYSLINRHGHYIWAELRVTIWQLRDLLEKAGCDRLIGLLILDRVKKRLQLRIFTIERLLFLSLLYVLTIPFKKILLILKKWTTGVCTRRSCSYALSLK